MIMKQFTFMIERKNSNRSMSNDIEQKKRKNEAFFLLFGSICIGQPIAASTVLPPAGLPATRQILQLRERAKFDAHLGFVPAREYLGVGQVDLPRSREITLADRKKPERHAARRPRFASLDLVGLGQQQNRRDTPQVRFAAQFAGT